MIRRPNVRARCLQPNLQARWNGNQKYIARSYVIYSRQCRWCKRPRTGASHWSYPGLCEKCGNYLLMLEVGDDHLDGNLSREEQEMRNSRLVRTSFGRYHP